MFDVVILTVIPDLTRKEFDALLPLVSQDKRERIKKIRFFRDAQNCLLGDIIARVEICRYSEFSMEQLKFTTNAYGKLLLVNCPYYHISISHSGHYVACAVADEPVGIDIELLKPIEPKVAERFFTSDEVDYIINGDYERCFYEVWTKKESRIKWEGKGLYKPLTSFSVFEFNEREQLTYHEVFQNDEAVCHVCSKKEVSPIIRAVNSVSFVHGVISL